MFISCKKVLHIWPKLYQYRHASAMKTWDLLQKLLLEVQFLFYLAFQHLFFLEISDHM